MKSAIAKKPAKSGKMKKAATAKLAKPAKSQHRVAKRIEKIKFLADKATPGPP